MRPRSLRHLGPCFIHWWAFNAHFLSFSIFSHSTSSIPSPAQHLGFSSARSRALPYLPTVPLTQVNLPILSTRDNTPLMRLRALIPVGFAVIRRGAGAAPSGDRAADHFQRLQYCRRKHPKISVGLSPHFGRAMGLSGFLHQRVLRPQASVRPSHLEISIPPAGAI